MALTPVPVLTFDTSGCPDCGRREVPPVPALPPIGDDFDWDLRDYDGFRLFLVEELAARFPARTRWTPADVEIVLSEVLASQLDKLSDMLDRMAAEQTLSTARRPESVRRLLQMIGYDAVELAVRREDAPFDKYVEPKDRIARLEQFWLDHPEKMEAARAAGPRSVRAQHRMVTLADYAHGLEGPPRHPLVQRAYAWSRWEGAWQLVRIAVIASDRRRLDDPGDYDDELWSAIEAFHHEHGVRLPLKETKPSVRAVLHPLIESRRMVGQPVELVDAVEVGVVMSLSIQVGRDHFRSDVRRAIEEALGTGPAGFFRAGRLRFGEDVWASDIVQMLVALDGVENVCINRFKRLGDRFPNEAASGRIKLQDIEIAVCDNVTGEPVRGYYRLILHGGRRG